MKKTFAFALLLAVSSSLSAAERTVVILRPDFLELVPQARYHIEVRSAYTIFNAAVQSDPASAANDKSRQNFPAPDVATLDFTSDTAAGIKPLVFHLPATLPAPDRGLSAAIEFSVLLQITPPAGSPLPPVSNEGHYLMRPATGTVTRCLRLRGPDVGDGILFIGVSDCERPLPARPVETH
jgi:hypothetical protein